MSYQFGNLGEEHQKALQSVLDRAASDKDYRDQLKSNPAKAVKSETGITVPEGFDIRFVENDADVTIVLPDYVDEIDEDSLEDVAGWRLLDRFL